MHRVGLIGGLSWASTVRYYEIINKAVQARVGGMASAPLLIDSLNFAQVGRSISDSDWAGASVVLTDAAKRLEGAGAEALLICANSMHRVYDQVAASVGVPIFHIADAVGEEAKAKGIRSAALVGTRNVMTERFYRQRIVGHGVSLLPADPDLVERIDRIVYDELVMGRATRESERFMKSEFTDIAKEDVQAIILACTELEAIVDVNANVLPILDSTRLHAMKAVDFILSS